MAEDSKEVATIDQTTGTAVGSATNWADRLAQFATEAVKAEAAPTGALVSAKAGVLQWQGQAVAGNKLDVVIIDSMYENALYEGNYDPDNPQSPVCFAFAHDEEDLRPHEKSEKPQSDTCANCAQNEWGTADRGRGKACKNIRRLAMVSAAPLEAEAITASEVAFMKLPVTSVKNWINHVNTLAAIDKRPPFAVVTTIGTVPDAKTQFKITFTKKDNINDPAILEAVIQRHEAQKATPVAPYAANGTVKEQAPKKQSGKF